MAAQAFLQPAILILVVKLDKFMSLAFCVSPDMLALFHIESEPCITHVAPLHVYTGV